MWNLRALAHEINGAPVSVHKTLRMFLLRETESLNCVGLKFQAAASDPCLYFIHRAMEGVAGVIATNIGDIL